MKLAHYQINQIKEYIGLQNIWYDDVKNELLDHIVCAVEAKMESHNLKFMEALTPVLDEIKPAKMQRQKLLTELKATFKAIGKEWLSFFMSSKIGLAFISLAFSIALVSFTNPKESLKLFQLISLLTLFFYFLIGTWRNKSLRPLNNAHFISRLNAICSSTLLIGAIVSLTISDWLIQNPLWLIAYMSIFSSLIIAGLFAMQHSYNQLKKHATL